MELTPWQIVLVVWGLILTIAQAINTIGSAAERIAKARAAANAPNEEQNKRLDDLEERMRVAEGKLGRDYAAFQALEQSTAVTQRALLALLGHGLHGNNVQEMQAAEQELKNHLTNHH